MRSGLQRAIAPLQSFFKTPTRSSFRNSEVTARSENPTFPLSFWTSVAQRQPVRIDSKSPSNRPGSSAEGITVDLG